MGKILTASLWFNADDPTEKESAKTGIRLAIDIAAQKQGMEHGPVSFRTLEPYDKEIATLPPPQFGPGTKCMVGEAKARPAFHVVKPKSGFTHELEAADLEILRAKTRQALDAAYPNDKDRSNARVDAIINEIGPETALKTLKSDDTVYYGGPRGGSMAN